MCLSRREEAGRQAAEEAMRAMPGTAEPEEVQAEVVRAWRAAAWGVGGEGGGAREEGDAAGEGTKGGEEPGGGGRKDKGRGRDGGKGRDGGAASTLAGMALTEVAEGPECTQGASVARRVSVATVRELLVEWGARGR